MVGWMSMVTAGTTTTTALLLGCWNPAKQAQKIIIVKMKETISQPRIEKIEKVWIPESKLYIPQEDKEIAFAYPAFGPDIYTKTGKELLKHNLTIPTAEQTAYLLHAVYCGPKEFTTSPEAKEIKRIMKDNWFWIFNQNLWTNKGVYVIHDSEAKGISEKLNSEDLEKKLNESIAGSPILYSSDGKVRFAPKESYRLGEHTPDSLAKDGFIIANYGVKGAEKLAEVSSKFKYEPKTFGFDETKEPILRVASLYSNRDLVDVRLDVGGYNWYDYGDGYAFGVLESCEAGAKNKQ
jgi:hypothetical protein